MKVLFAGDWHGNWAHVSSVFQAASYHEVDYIIQLGDFGYWPHMDKNFPRKVSDAVRSSGIPCYWLPGNHENWDVLDQMVLDQPEGLIPMNDNEDFLFIPRGCRFELEGVKFLGMGGAWSVDWRFRNESPQMSIQAIMEILDDERREQLEAAYYQASWWPQELVTQKHVDAVSDERVDVLLTHDCPYGDVISYKDELEVSVGQRKLLLELANKVKAPLVYAGHHHVRATFQLSYGGIVEVLNRDAASESFLIKEF